MMNTPRQTRLQDADLVAHIHFENLAARLPISWPTPSDLPVSPKNQYRSQYRYPGCEKLKDPAAWTYLSLFEILLYLIDFSGLRPVLAQLLGWQTSRGQVPFDPVSMFLLFGWQLTNQWSRAKTLKKLADPRYADLAAIFGFEAGVFPTEGGCRYFLTTLGRNSTCDDHRIVLDETTSIARQRLNDLIVQSVYLLLDTGIISPQAWEKAQICPDGMLHTAASRMRCAHVKASCYEPTSPDKPRPCPAQDKGKQGCSCDTLVCTTTCCFASPRDTEARFVFYSGHNQPHHSPNKTNDPKKQKKSSGRAVFGYRSLPVLLSDPNRRFHVILADDFHPANLPEPPPVAALYHQLSDWYPSLNVDVVSGDAAFGTKLILQTVYHHLRARRVMDLRSHETDHDPTNWLLRGYDDRGRPLCPFGYRLVANGYDPQRLRRKYFCNQLCSQGTEPVVALDTVPHPPVDCPHLSSDHPLGLILNVGERFADGSIRLVRDVLVGSPAWKRLYHRPRNASEGRNASFEFWGLKRLSVFGLARGRATIFQADVWANLTTLARLIREATLAASPP